MAAALNVKSSPGLTVAFEFTASLFARTVSWTSSLEVENSRLAVGFAHSVWSETTFEDGVLVTNGDVELDSLDGSQSLALSLSDLRVDVANRIVNLDPGVCPDSGSVSVASSVGDGEVEFHSDGTVTLFVNGVEVPQAAQACRLADIYLSVLLGA